MKTLLLKLALACMALWPAKSLLAQDLLYFVELNSFYDNEGRPYVEINLDINAYSVAYARAEGGGFQGSVDVKLEISPAGKPEQKAYERSFDLLSPPVSDTTRAGTAFGILDLRRVSLEPGSYVLTGHLQDNQRPNALKHRFTKEFIIDPQPSDRASISSVAFIQSMTPTASAQPHSKHGFDIIPLVNDGNFIDMDTLRYYVETYHSNRKTQSVYFASVFVTPANSSSKLKAYARTTRQNARDLDILTGAFNISALGTGTYYLNVELYNHLQELVGTTARKFYIINNRLTQPTEVTEAAYREHFNLTEEELDLYIRTIAYISTATEQDFAAALKTLPEKQNYFYNFWEKRKEKPIDPPSKPWLSYKARVDYANQNYKAAHLAGWRTDMGRVLLQHGPPNDIERYPSSNTMHPHEIWRYNKLLTQANVRFIFYNPNESVSDWALLHSDLRGERNNPRYEFDLVRSTMDGNLDVNKIDGTKQR